ncbi:MAG TPA: DUF4412 domain-containing protein [Puia sp.]|nr:DUF4412 domain-containing protein [Puia sp.]
MKRIYTGLAVILMTTALPLASGAQVLKNLMSNMKQPAPGATYSRPGVGPSISPADSAAAIKAFMTSTGGSGLLYQYRVIYTFKGKNNKDSTSSDTLSTAVTDGHNICTDLDLPGTRMQVLGHAGMPRYSVRVFPDSKTYVFNIIDTAALKSGGGMVYEVARIGNERVLGYSCIHSRLTIYPAGVKSVGTTEDIWTSVDVPGYADFKRLALNQNVTPKMMEALEQAGCGGSFVKVEMHSKIISMDMQLITAERRNFPASMFQIPQGYTRKSSANPFAR